jgi:putative adenylate-forming enzyme
VGTVRERWSNMLGTLLKQYFLTKFRSFKSREQLEKWQNQRVDSHLKWVLQHSSFYRELYQDSDLKNWRELPMISKAEMMGNFSELNTCGLKKEEAFAVAMQFEEGKIDHSSIGEMTIGLSTGTSGNRGLFLVSPQERFSWAGAMLAKMLPGTLFKRHRIAFFFRTTSPLYNSIRSSLIQFEYYHLQESVEEHVRRLNFQQPTILAAPPSMLRKLASEVKKGNLNISPKKIISVAEVLDPVDEAFIASVFDQKVHQIYQATEGFLATTCSHGTLHLNEDILVIQKERNAGDSLRFYPIITDFCRFSQPIIRYKLNDILQEKKEVCPCGSVFTALECIEGRADDVFYFESKDGLKPVFPDFIRKAIIISDQLLEEYKVVQVSAREIQVFLQPFNEEIQNAVENKLKALLHEQRCSIPKMIFSPYEESVSTKKLRRIERKFAV